MLAVTTKRRISQDVIPQHFLHLCFAHLKVLTQCLCSTEYISSDLFCTRVPFKLCRPCMYVCMYGRMQERKETE